jgi:thiol-disulfide isomerase/thioredoxin
MTKGMKPVDMRWLAGIAVVALALVAIGVGRHHRHVLHPGDRLIPIQLSSISGAPQTFSASHRPTIINVFATWCTPCREETPGFAHAAGALRARGFDIVAIDQQEPAAAVSAFAREFALPYPVYIDTTGVTHSVLGARIIPMTILVNRDGVIVWEHAGPLDPADLQAAISQTGMSG